MSASVATETVRLELNGLDCADCARTVEASLAAMPGVERAAVSFAGGTAEVAFDPARTDVAALAGRVRSLGYGAREAKAGAWLFDVAVGLNDWAVDLPTGAHDPERASAFVRAYASVRPLSAAERQLLPAMLRAGALRFWISRLWDFHLPRDASLLKAHDPSHFERVLRQRVAHPVRAADL